MKKYIAFFSFVLFVIGASFVYLNRLDILLFFRDNILHETSNIKIKNNSYYKDDNYLYIKNTSNFVAKDKDHLIEIIYSIVNSGNTNSTFYCASKYKECINDISDLLDKEDSFYFINNFVHPYNNFQSIYLTYSNYGKVVVEVTKKYTDEEIAFIENKVKEVIDNLITPNMSDTEKIKVIHDYIINNSKYKEDNSDEKYASAYDILKTGYGVCNAYADLMAIFLNHLDIPNYEISSDNHIWNLVYLDKWYHLDLTWDDPVTNTGVDLLKYDYFLITDKELKELGDLEHIYNKDIFLETNY